MSDGLLPKCPIWENVQTFNGSTTSAQGCGGGFPCQADAVFVLSWKLTGFCLFTCKFDFPLACQGISQAGRQAGLEDLRSYLVTENFRVYDTLADGTFRLS